GYNRADELVAYHVALVEIDDRYARDIFQRLQRFHDAGAFVRRQIDLGHVAGNHAFGTRTDAREQHKHLLGGGVLRFIENHERVVQGSTAHVSEWPNFDCLSPNRALDLFRLKHVAKRVIKWAQIGRDLLFELAWQKSKRLAGFHGWSGQN